MSFFEAVAACFSKYIVFEGRARRSEYWFFLLFYIILNFVVDWISFNSTPVIHLVYLLVTLFPFWAVTVRRLHDTGKSGWRFFIFFIVPLVGCYASLGGAIGSLYHGDLGIASSSLELSSIFGLVLIIGAILMLVWLCQDSDMGSNEYGENPKLSSEAQSNINQRSYNLGYSNQGSTLSQSSGNTPSSSTDQATSNHKKTYEPVVGVETDSLIKRAFLFLEDGENYEAERYIEQALNQDPENPHVYMAKLMLEHEVSTPEELIQKLPKPLENEKLYQRALRFADEEYKLQLESYAQAVHDKFEQERQAKEAAEIAKKEETYQEILKEKKEATTADELLALLNKIRSIMPYKDTKKLYEEVQTTWMNEKNYKSALIAKKYADSSDSFRRLIKELEPLAKLKYKDSKALLAEARELLIKAEQAEQRKLKIQIILFVAFIAFIIGGAFWYKRYSAEQEKRRIYQEAEARRVEAQRQEAERRAETKRQVEARRQAEAQRQSYESDYAKGEEYLNAKDYSPAQEIFRRLANDGYAPAQDKLAWMYQNGWGVEQSYSQAVSWYRKAAEQGNTEAMASMGLMYYRGWGVTQNYDTALEWYGKAAAQGSEVAQRRINSIQLLKVNKAKIAEIERGTGFPVPGTIFAETLSVRQSPDTNSRRVKTLKTGHPVSVSRVVDSDNDYWFYIKTASGTEGWVLGGYVKLVDRDLTYEESRNRRCSLPKSGHVRTSSQSSFLNLRNIPAVKGSDVVEKLDNGESFTAYEVFAGDTIDWYRIRTSFTGNEGWVSGKYIELNY